MSFKDVPWFEDASIRQISHVELPSAHHLYWPDLDIALAVDSLTHPDRYPLVSQAQPGKRLQPTKARPRVVTKQAVKGRMVQSRKRPSKALRQASTHASRVGGRSQVRPGEDPEREERITMEVVVDAYDASERAMGWFGYLEAQLECPFTARCIERRAISPLLVDDEVEVISLAPADECAHEIFVMIRWEDGGLGVPLSQIKAHSAGGGTGIAVADWYYWVHRGYQF